MRKIFVSGKQVTENVINIIDKDEVHHLKDVLRKQCADHIVICADNDEYDCVITAITRAGISAKINKKITHKAAKSSLLTLACAIPKRAKFDLIVEKTTELGVDKIIPLITERSIVRPKADSLAIKLMRWQRISRQASQQSGRADITNVEDILTFEQLAKHFLSFDCILIANLSSSQRIPLIEAFKFIKNKKNILLLIGPEGDFSSREVQLAFKHKAVPVSIGGNILKVETAAIICTGVLSLFLQQV
jgi:16S rRNA (uracil1498-N3)-methyltransferase